MRHRTNAIPLELSAPELRQAGQGVELFLTPALAGNADTFLREGMDMSTHEQGDTTVARSEHGRDVVTIIVNAVEREIRRGRQPVSEIKRIGEVPQADQLEQVIDGKLVPLADDAAVTIKGGEEFVSHPRDSGSSEG